MSIQSRLGVVSNRDSSNSELYQPMNISTHNLNPHERKKLKKKMQSHLKALRNVNKENKILASPNDTHQNKISIDTQGKQQMNSPHQDEVNVNFDDTSMEIDTTSVNQEPVKNNMIDDDLNFDETCMKSNTTTRNQESMKDDRIEDDSTDLDDTRMKSNQTTRKQESINNDMIDDDLIIKRCSKILKLLMNHKYGYVFNEPVDPIKLNLPTYHLIIKNPMDLGTIRKNLEAKQYVSADEFVKDVRLTFSNAMTYNEVNSAVYKMAQTLLKLFEKEWNKKVSIKKEFKLPKPKPDEPNKRPMTDEEVNRLEEDLRLLPPSKDIQVQKIVAEMNADENNEVVIEYENQNPEIMWALDRLVTNWKKSRNKKPRI